MRKTERPAGRRFQLILIKPSHYDDDGYVVQWLRSTMPSNSLAAVFSLAKVRPSAGILGPDLPIDVYAIDETNTRVQPARRSPAASPTTAASDLVGIVGVQSNEFPRALDIARPLRAAGVQVVIGGFHVSGCLAMLKEMPGRHQSRAGSRHLDLRRRGRGRPRRGRCSTPRAASFSRSTIT